MSNTNKKEKIFCKEIKSLSKNKIKNKQIKFFKMEKYNKQD